jgi:hypothetical protein
LAVAVGHDGEQYRAAVRRNAGCKPRRDYRANAARDQAYVRITRVAPQVHDAQLPINADRLVFSKTARCWLTEALLNAELNKR